MKLFKVLSVFLVVLMIFCGCSKASDNEVTPNDEQSVSESSDIPSKIDEEETPGKMEKQFEGEKNEVPDEIKEEFEKKSKEIESNYEKNAEILNNNNHSGAKTAKSSSN